MINTSLVGCECLAQIWEGKKTPATIVAVWLNTFNPKHPHVEFLIKIGDGNLYPVRSDVCTIQLPR